MGPVLWGTWGFFPPPVALQLPDPSPPSASPLHCRCVCARARTVPMQPWIYAQAPRLRLTDSKCPDVTRRTYGECYSERRVAAAGVVAAAAADAEAFGAAGANATAAHGTINAAAEEGGVTICSSSKQSFTGVSVHRERPYLAAMLQCAQPTGLGDKCVQTLLQLWSS